MAGPLRILRTPDHRYGLADETGAVVEGWHPGVTTILSVVARPALTRWLRTETARLAVAERSTLFTIADATGDADAASWLAGQTERIAAEGAARGGGVHAHVEALTRGEDPGPPSEVAAPYVAAWQAWRTAYGPRFAGVEVPVFSGPVRYGGTADAVLVDPAGALWAIDYKTRRDARSAAVYDTEVLQLAALSRADLVAPDGLDGAAVAMPAIDHAAVVLLRPDGSWRFVPVRIGQAEFVAWTAVRALHEWLTGEARRAKGSADSGASPPALVAA